MWMRMRVGRAEGEVGGGMDDDTLFLGREKCVLVWMRRLYLSLLVSQHHHSDCGAQLYTAEHSCLAT